MKKIFKIIVLILAILFILHLCSCGGKKEKEVVADPDLTSVVVKDSSGVFTYDWTKVQTIDGTTVIPTGIRRVKSEPIIPSLEEMARIQKILQGFEDQHGFKVISFQMVPLSDQPQVYLVVVHEKTTAQKAEETGNKIKEKAEEAWEGVKKIFK